VGGRRVGRGQKKSEAKKGWEAEEGFRLSWAGGRKYWEAEERCSLRHGLEAERGWEAEERLRLRRGL